MKISLIRTSCGRHLVMHGSANLRSSCNMEQFAIDNDRDLYEFHAGWILLLGLPYSHRL